MTRSASGRFLPERFLSWSLCTVFWTASLLRGGYDQWTSVVLFFLLSLSTIIWVWTTSYSFHCPLLIPSILVLIAVGISVPGSWDVAASKLEFWVWSYSLVAFYLAYQLFQTSEERTAVWQRMGWIAVPLALIAIHQQITGRPDSMGRWEIHATLVNANVLAGFALFFSVFFAASRQVTLSAASALLLLGLSRSTLGCFIFMGALLIAHRKHVLAWRERHPQLFAVISVLVVGYALSIVAIKIADRIPPYYSGSGRLVYWAAALRMIENAPLTGIGISAYGTAYPFFKIVSDAQNSLLSHSSLLGFSAETGVFGFIAVAAWIWAWRREARPTPALGLAIGSVVVFGLFNVHLEYFVHKLLLQMALAAALPPGLGWSVQLTPLRRIFVTGVIVLLVPFWLAPFQSARLSLEADQALLQNHAAIAERYYRAALRLDADNAQAHWGLARLLDQKDPDKSRYHRQRAVALKRTYARLHN